MMRAMSGAAYLSEEIRVRDVTSNVCVVGCVLAGDSGNKSLGAGNYQQYVTQPKTELARSGPDAMSGARRSGRLYHSVFDHAAFHTAAREREFVQDSFIAAVVKFGGAVNTAGLAT